MFVLFIQISWNNWQEMISSTLDVDNDLDLSLLFTRNRIRLD